VVRWRTFRRHSPEAAGQATGELPPDSS
jgi:hypothetical protein